MQNRFCATALFMSVFFVRIAAAQNVYYLPQVANGDSGSGIYRTTFVLFNNTNNPVGADLDLTDNDGNAMPMTFTGYGTGSNFSFDLPAGASKLLQTDGLGRVVVGAATVTSSASIGVSAIFSIYDAKGNYQTETGVGSSEPQKTFVLPVDTTGFFNTGLALYNPDGEDATITLTLRDTNGQTVGAPVPLLPKLGSEKHIARFVSEFFPTLGSFQGTLLVQSSTPIAAMVLRQYYNPSPLTLSFTSLPVVPTSLTKTSFNLAQVADGGGYKTSLLIFNISSSPANVSVELTKTGGGPLSVNIPGRGNGSNFTITNLAPGGSVFLQTDGAPSSTATGAAKITSNVPVGASGVFTVLSGGVFQTETGVTDSALMTSFTLPVDITGNFDTGVAFFCPTGTANLTFRRFDITGTQVGTDQTKTITSQLAIFVSEIFNVRGVRGSVAVTSDTPVAAMTLRMNNPPLSFTTLPVVSGAKGGDSTGSTAALLSKTETGVTATSDITLNEVLPSGFRLTGTISGPGTGVAVLATSGQSTYPGTVNPQGRYIVVLPAGTYSLSVSFTPTGVPATQNVYVTSVVSGTVQVSADTTRDIVLPAVPLYTISGVVNGLINLGTPSGLGIEFVTADRSIDASYSLSLNGNYTGVIPAGNYTAGITASISGITSTGLSSQSLGLFNLGTASVNANTTLPAFTVPATAKLSGTVRGTTVPAIGVSVRAAVPNGSVGSVSQVDLISSQYQAVLPKSLTYGVNVSMALLQGTNILGFITFPVSPNTLTLNGDTSGYDFTVPTLPGRFTISGRVTDSGGKPVNGASVSAFSQSITGAPSVQFGNSAQTDASGNYSLSVLSGTNYSLIYAPPLPAQ